ncbi:MAG: sn-glycerol-3-phosphate ABC transporter ATP-binding protein UgpC [Fulvimonas sp.]|jgi:multiple sugar transport system ATP-binding protein|nr:sn-glycerol-3-phosphate ABC transporter ATP-binding protein UgpC [Fulvimonas sp.]
MTRVALHQLRKVYPDGQVAVEAATFTIESGELMVLVGPSGCGKTTLLRMIAGLEQASAGTLRIGDRVVDQLPPAARDIAMVFQNYALYPHMTVAGNLGFGLRLRGMGKAEVARRVREVAALLELDDRLDALPSALSGGQRQRVALGRALVREPKVFLLDEPLSHLDARLRVAMRLEIARLHQRLGATMIYVTHDQIEAMTLGQRIVVFDRGRIQQIDTPMNLYRRPCNLFVAGFIGSPAMNFLPGRLRRDEGRWWLDTAHGAVPLAEAAPWPEDWRGREVVLGVRPEDLAPATPAEAMLQAYVEVVEPVGNEVFLNLRFDGRPLVVRLPPRLMPAPGERLPLRFDPVHVHLFDAADGARLECDAGRTH